MEHDDAGDPNAPDPDYVPVGRARKLEWNAPLRWLRAGWDDICRAPAFSLAYGAAIVAASYLVTAITYLSGNMLLLIALLTGFMFVGPVLAYALYDESKSLENHRRPSVEQTWAAVRGNFGDQAVFAIVLLVILLVWARAAALIHVFFPALSNPGWDDLLPFLGIGLLVGGLFAFLVFGISVFSLPMMLDKRADVITAAITSVRAVSDNFGVMVLWGAIIVAAVAVGVLTAFLGLMITIPLIGHASWHAYRDTISHPAEAARRS